MAAPKHCEEEARLSALYRYSILDTPVQQEYEDITRLASYICGTPIAVVNLIDRDRQWFKSEVGLGVRETPLDNSLCAHAILQPGLFIVPDTLRDDRFACNPLVCGEPHLRFYAGALLESSEGYPLGTLCVLDHEPRELTAEQKQSLLALGRQVMRLIEASYKAAALAQSQEEVGMLVERLQRTMTESNHRIKNSLQVISALIEMQLMDSDATISISVLTRLSQHVRGISTIHDLLTEQSKIHSDLGIVSAAAALQKLVPILQGMGNGRHIQAHVDDIPLSIKQANSLTLLVNELVSNAIKHGGPSDIEISLAAVHGQAQLEVLDRGPGFPAGFNPARAAHTGLDLIETLSRIDLLGDVEFLNREAPGGARVVVTFPMV